MLAHLIDWFGSPEALVREGPVNRRWVWDFTPRLRPLLLLVHRLVLAEAHALAEAPPPEPTPSKAPPRPTPRASAHAPLWRGRFRLALAMSIPRRPRAPLPRRTPALCAAPPIAETGAIPVLPFARRLDALQRVLAHPLRTARRIAARLRRNNLPPRALARPTLSARTPDREVWREPLREAHALALRRDSG